MSTRRHRANLSMPSHALAHGERRRERRDRLRAAPGIDTDGPVPRPLGPPHIAGETPPGAYDLGGMRGKVFRPAHIDQRRRSRDARGEWINSYGNRNTPPFVPAF